MADQQAIINPAEVNKPTSQTKDVAQATAAPSSRSKFLRIAVVAAIVLVAAIVIWKEFFAAPKIPDSIVVLSGRIEGDDSAIAPKTSGRILELRVREGDTVKAGDVIAILDDEQ